MSYLNVFESTGRFLAFGADRALVWALMERGWTGVYVRETEAGQAPGLVPIVGVLTTDPRLVQTLDGYYVRSLTIEDIFKQFPGPYDLIAAIGTGRDREIWHHECVFNALPKMYVLGEDGHNEEVMKVAADRGYDKVNASDGHLVLVHQ